MNSGTPELYFPSVPEPKEGVVVPLDIDFKTVKDNETEIQYVLMPYWYWNLVVDYMVKTETAVSVLQGD